MASFQSQLFLDRLGDMWFDANRDDLGKRDPVTELLEEAKIVPNCFIEIGCSNGWRVKKLKAKYGCEGYGIDPSSKAVESAHDAHIVVGLAEQIPCNDHSFDLVILGYCLYAINPQDWFSVISETDRVLSPGGHLLIWDWVSPRPFKRKMVLEEDYPTWMYHMDWPPMWLANPLYSKVMERHYPLKAELVTILKKNTDDGLPVQTDEGHDA